MLRPLYEIANEFESLMRRMLEQEEITPEYKAEIDLLECTAKEKMISVGAFIKNLEVEENAMEQAVDAITIRQNRIRQKIYWLQGYLKENMERCEISEIKSPYFDVRIRQNPLSVTIQDEKFIPEKYFIECVTRRLDKVSLARDLKNGDEVPGVVLERKTRIEIK